MAHRSYVFSANDGTHGQELWVTDGTAAGTHLVDDINTSSIITTSGATFPGSSNPAQFTDLGTGRTLFTAADATHGLELWVTDGTPGGTQLLSDFYTGNGSAGQPNSSSPYDITALGNGQAVFGVTYGLGVANGATATGLAVSDGTAAGTKLISSIAPQFITAVGNGDALFTANLAGKQVLYATDGTAAGTHLISNAPGPYDITSLNNGKDLFFSIDANAGTSLWMTDGGSNTRQIVSSYGTNVGFSILATGSAYVADPMADLGTGRAVFAGTDGTHSGVWVSDGTSAGTKLLSSGTLSAGQYLVHSNFTALGNGQALFSGGDNTHGTELWTTDGTAAGTHILSDINPNYSVSSTGVVTFADSGPFNVTALGNGTAVFSADDGQHGRELWVTNGTTGGTHLVADINPGANASSPSQFKALGDGRATFQADDGVHGAEQWITDGTAAGTHLVADINPGSNYSVDPFGFTYPDASISQVYVPPVAGESFNFKFSDAKVTFANGIDLLTGPDGVAHDVTGVHTLIFNDGTINENSGSGMVDALYYYAKNLDVWAAHVDPTTHYDQSGWKEGRDPNANFSTNGYLAANPDVKAAGIDPLVHYNQTGWKEGRDPSANFDNELYLRNNPDVKAANIDPLAHYLGGGQAEGRQASTTIGQSGSFTVHGSFDAEYYLLNNPDVAKAAQAAGGDPYAFAYQHYDAQGWKEGRNPSAYFDTNYYLANNPDVKAAHIDPLTHYDQGGWTEGRDPSAVFHTSAYLAANPDVASAHVDPLLHYLQSGADAGRHLA